MDNLLIACICVYLLSFVFLRKRQISMALFLFASLLNVSLIFWNWYFIGQPPFGNMYHVLIILGACFFPAYLVIVVRKKMDWLAGYFSLLAALSIFSALILKKDDLWHQSPALQSIWFIPHVVSYIISYSMATIAFLLELVAFVKKKVRNSADVNKEKDISYQLLAFAFPLMTFGLISGAIWADRIWGSYWSWADSKETWSLITWMLYVIYFHCRKIPQIRDYAGIAHVFAFLALLTTFLLVNLMPQLSSPLHSYQ